MRKPGSYPNRTAAAFGLPEAPALVAHTLRGEALDVTELRYDAHSFGSTTLIPQEDSYLVSLLLRACPRQDLYFDGRKIRHENLCDGVTTIFDLRREPTAVAYEPFHLIMFRLPMDAIDEVSREVGGARVRELRDYSGIGVNDSVARHLLSSLMPALAKPHEAHPLFLSHVALALCTHMATAYGGIQTPARRTSGGLARWQEQRAKELMMASVNNQISLRDLANECGLSVRHFTRAFRQVTGMSPHHWLTLHRVDVAKSMLLRRDHTLAAVALSCGFADQSHFTRVFSRMTGFTPNAWRAMHGFKTRLIADD